MKKSFLVLGIMLAASPICYGSETSTGEGQFDLKNIDKMIDESGIDTSEFSLDNIDNILSGKTGSGSESVVDNAQAAPAKSEVQTDGSPEVVSVASEVIEAEKVTSEDDMPAEDELDKIASIEVGGETVEISDTPTEDELAEQEKYRKTFLSNVPAKSILISNKNFLFQPNREFYMFDDGERVVDNPLSMDNKFATFCYFKLTKTNDRVLLPRHETRGLKITYSESLRHDLEDVVIYAHRFSFAENERFSSFTCLSSEKNEPLRIEDINYETGDSFKIKFAPVVTATLFE